MHFASVVFEGIRIYNKKAFRLNAHIKRLFKSAKILDINIPYTRNVITNSCNKVIKKQNLINGYLRPVIWRGGQSMAPGITNAKTIPNHVYRVSRVEVDDINCDILSAKEFEDARIPLFKVMVCGTSV